MKTRELIKLLSKYKDKEVYVKVDKGLFYPITSVKTYDGNTIILCRNIETSVESSDFKLPVFETSVKTNKKQ